MERIIKGAFRILLILLPVSVWGQGPVPGDIYREYTRTLGHTNFDWRVTGPNVKREDARIFLPNPVLDIRIDDLKGAVKAEVLLDRWGGHAGTMDKKIRFNGNDWISLPELTTTPPGQRPESYHYQDNPIIPVPLEQLKEGLNTFEGTCDTTQKGWPQWGWDAVIMRIYYDASKPHPTGKITSPVAGETFGENPVITADAKAKAGIERIDFLAYYDGYDENGDGIYQDWHHHYWCIRGDKNIDIRGHVGTAFEYPYAVKWDTSLLPDQEKGTVKLMARIKDKNGIWYVTNVVEGLSLERNGYSIKMFTASDIPISFNVRNYQAKTCKIRVAPETELENAVEAWFYIRTWNGYARNHEPFTINEWPTVFQGHNHNFDMDLIPIPVIIVRPGDNLVSFYSKTIHHGAEVLWPGPAFIVRFQHQKGH
ncbi:MAG: hypothetical protein JXR41_10450 [Bacteroidales bacterium]|nr:hypothetical protein [Bacteroidales bacterium]